MSLLSIILPKPACSQVGESATAVCDRTKHVSQDAESAAQPLETGLAGKLAEKIAGGWLVDRRALIFPLDLDLADLDESQRDSIVHVLISAAAAHAPWSDESLLRVSKALEPAIPDKAKREAAIAQARKEPRALGDLLDGRDQRMATLFYALSLLAIDRKSPTGRHYLRFVAARLRLPKDVTWRLEQRYRL